MSLLLLSRGYEAESVNQEMNEHGYFFFNAVKIGVVRNTSPIAPNLMSRILVPRGS